MCDRDGALIAFAATKAEREAKNDPRPSLAERYKSADEYVTRVKAAADRLVKDKLLLPADAAAYVEFGEEGHVLTKVSFPGVRRGPRSLRPDSDDIVDRRT